ncbi:MAG: Arc family DNA-binding protein, partial [Pseudomonadota bacterium]|nr:Arc family DNA-binding protein [Pseudomonadota bacterium]
AITLKNIPDNLYENLKIAAQEHHRSINAEILACLEKELMPVKVSPQQRLAKARAIRAKLKLDNVDPNEIEQAIIEGRP